MLYDNLQFNAMKSSLDALWLKQRIISDNIANYETPGYKAKSVAFQQELEQAEQKNAGRSNGDKIKFKAVVTTDDSSSIRPDGNNVNMEKESLELWRSYAQYNYLSDKLNAEFKNMRYVLNNALK